jgi:hypothetical protein
MAKSRASATTDPPGISTRNIPTRASTSKNPTDLTRDELVNIGRTETDVQTVKEAIHFLERASYVSNINDPLDTGKFGLILLQIAQAAGSRMARPTRDAIRSVALILEDFQVQKVAKAVTKMVERDIERPLSRMEQVGTAADDIIGVMKQETSNLIEATRENIKILNHNQNELAEYERRVSTAASNSKNKLEEVAKVFQETSEKCLSALEEKVNNVTENLEKRFRDLTDHYTAQSIHPSTLQSSRQTNQPFRPGSGPSYRDVAAAGSEQREDSSRKVTWEDLNRERNISWSDEPALSRIEAQVELRERQLLINIQEGGTLASMGHLLIVEKANEGLEALSQPDRYKGAFTTATHLRNGRGVLLEANCAEVLAWIRMEGRREFFSDFMEKESTIKDRTYPVVINFVPITFRPHLDVDLRETEEVNGFKNGELITARWFKPEHRRAEGQRFAHCLVQFSSPDTANTVLRNGMSICHKRVYARKKKKEPIRCLKCQMFGHISHSCSSPIDVCGTCTGNHRTETCRAYRTFKCANCGDQGDGHASWSRECPTFSRKCQELDDRTPENNMPYFPTARAWTQVLEPPERAPPPPPPPHPPTAYPSHPQSGPGTRDPRRPMHQFKDPSGKKQSTINFNFLPKNVKDIIAKSIEESSTSTANANTPLDDSSATSVPADAEAEDSDEGLYANDTNDGRRSPPSQVGSELEVQRTIVDETNEVVDLK